jgi:predicted protein tyrosine phosphatase
MNTERSSTADTSSALAFASVAGGKLALGHRPGRRAYARLKRAGVTHIATILSRAEDAEAIGEAVRQAGFAWLWLDLGSTKNLPSLNDAAIRSAVDALYDALTGGGRVLLHCSAGIHRTGMIAAALLYRLGYDDAGTIACLTAMREITARGVGEARLAWGRSFARNSAQA